MLAPFRQDQTCQRTGLTGHAPRDGAGAAIRRRNAPMEVPSATSSTGSGTLGRQRRPQLQDAVGASSAATTQPSRNPGLADDRQHSDGHAGGDQPAGEVAKLRVWRALTDLITFPALAALVLSARNSRR